MGTEIWSRSPRVAREPERGVRGQPLEPADTRGTHRRALWLLASLLPACATFHPTASLQDLNLSAREQTQSRADVRVSVALLRNQEAAELFGLDLATRGVQPLWMEIENRGEKPLWFLPTGLDPEYFSPLEVTYAYHGAFAEKTNAAMDRHIETLSFSNPILPGKTVSGFVYTNSSIGTKIVDVDLIGSNRLSNFTFSVPVPDSRLADRIPDPASLYRAGEVVDLEQEQVLREALAGLPCCVRDTGGGEAEPLNLVLIGDFDAATRAFIRRGYRATVTAPRYLFGRPQDLAGEKTARWVSAQGHQVRVWLAPLTYRGRAVWLGQTSQRRGGRFAPPDQPDPSAEVDPYVDDARNALLQDLLYSQTVAKLGFVAGAGGAGNGPLGSNARAVSRYQTDGLRAVLLLEGQPVSLRQIGYFDWERLIDHVPPRGEEAALPAQGAESGEVENRPAPAQPR